MIHDTTGCIEHHEFNAACCRLRLVVLVGPLAKRLAGTPFEYGDLGRAQKVLLAIWCTNTWRNCYQFIPITYQLTNSDMLAMNRALPPSNRTRAVPAPSLIKMPFTVNQSRASRFSGK